MNKHAASGLVFALVLGLAHAAGAQPAEPVTDPAAPPPLPPASDPLAEPPTAPPPVPDAPPPPAQPTPRFESQPPPEAAPGEREPMSEGRRIVVAYNEGFHFGLSPGVVFSRSQASFFLGVRFEYGFDTGSVIVVPGVRLAAYFSDPAVYLGMPVMKLVYPIDRFAPFIEGGAGVGYVGQDQTAGVSAKTGVALLAGGGFMVHFTWKFGLGVEANYQTITGSDFHGISVGPILALAF